MSKTFPIQAVETSGEQFWIRNYSRSSFIAAQRLLGETSFFWGLGEITLLRSQTEFSGLVGPGCFLLALGKCNHGQLANRSLRTKCTEPSQVKQQIFTAVASARPPVGL